MQWKAVSAQSKPVEATLVYSFIIFFSILAQTYGKGTGKDCRRHVQKLNMIRAKREKEDGRSEQHPPQDYASTFTTHEGDDAETPDQVYAFCYLQVA